MKFIQYTWEELDNDLALLAEIIERNLTPKQKYIYGVPRGGSIIAVILSHKLDLKYSVSDGRSIHDTIIVDDIADTGKTLKYYVDFGYQVYTIHYKEQSSAIPSYYVNKVNNDDWIVYPWENKVLAKYDYDKFMRSRL